MYVHACVNTRLCARASFSIVCYTRRDIVVSCVHTGYIDGVFSERPVKLCLTQLDLKTFIDTRLFKRLISAVMSTSNRGNSRLGVFSLKPNLVVQTNGRVNPYDRNPVGFEHGANPWSSFGVNGATFTAVGDDKPTRDDIPLLIFTTVVVVRTDFPNSF